VQGVVAYPAELDTLDCTVRPDRHRPSLTTKTLGPTVQMSRGGADLPEFSAIFLARPIGLASEVDRFGCGNVDRAAYR
jgi:hypothetical protein